MVAASPEKTGIASSAQNVSNTTVPSQGYSTDGYALQGEAATQRIAGDVGDSETVAVVTHDAPCPPFAVVTHGAPTDVPVIPVRLFFAEGPVPVATNAVNANENELVPAGCNSCGGGGGVLKNSYSGPTGTGGYGGCGSGVCYPGRKTCYPCESTTVVGRFLCGVYECLCCPDPCYDPKWTPIADAAFFAGSARPQTTQRLRWDSGFNLEFPDRAEYFWARADGMGLGPFPKLPAFRGEKKVSYDELTMYTETATGLIAFFVEMSYRSIYPDLASHAVGFSDMNLGTKTLIYDCELFQLSFQMKTFILTGNFGKGLGAGHVSLEPSVLLGVRLGPETYLQGQVAEWIPFGDPTYSGALVHSHTSLNQVLWNIMPDVPLIGTMELNTWSFQDGAYTDPFLGSFQKASGTTYASLGPGLRLVICDKIDFGIGTAFAVTTHHWAEQLYRSEFRWRF